MTDSKAIATHTPGPWRIERFADSPHSRIQPAGKIADGGSLADVYGNDANAQLIAVAPEMLAELAEIAALSDESVSQADPALVGAIRAAARALVAKTEPRQ